MPDLLIEENHRYGVDCHNALWASDDMHTLYHSCGLSEYLCDADFAIEISDYIILVEYKNANIPEALVHATETEEFNPADRKKMNKIVSKFYDSMHYLRLVGKTKPVKYVYVLEYPKGDSTSRKMLRNRLKKGLPFKLQESVGSETIIESFDVMSIHEWNEDSLFGYYPFVTIS